MFADLIRSSNAPGVVWLVATLAFVAPAAAADEAEHTPRPLHAPAPGALEIRRASAVFDAALHVGFGWTSLLSRGDTEAAAEIHTGSVDLSIAVSTFVGRRLKLGYEATLGDRRVLGGRDVRGDAPWPFGPIEGDAWMLLPVGGYLALYPFSRVDAYVAVHLGTGIFWPDDYLSSSGINLAALFAAELGVERDLSDRARWALSLRYAATDLSIGSLFGGDFGGQTAHELALGVRISVY